MPLCLSVCREAVEQFKYGEEAMFKYKKQIKKEFYDIQSKTK